MKPNNNQFDVAIIGSGIAGSTLASILARQGQKVILFEASSHPKFAIGESMILETSEIMRSMAEFYDVPELAYFSSENYFEHIGTSHGVKRHFSYAHHTEDQPFNRDHTLQAVIPKQPHGHELHLYRQDTDYFLMTVAIRYGAKVLQKTNIQSVHIDADGVQLTTDREQEFQAEYVVDAGGFRSLLAEKFDLRHHDLPTHSRAIFTHMVEVPCYHEVSATKESYQLPFQLSEGTLHHVFEGGWLWVIPFNNHAKSTNPLCSVGLMLDPRVHPQQSELSPEAEFYQFIERFPGIAAQFTQAKAVRDWTRTGRIQYSVKQVVGDRNCLLGQAAGFIDPLFSKGLYTSLSCTSLLADRLLAAHKTGDYSASFFKPVEEMTLGFIQANDHLVANAYRSFADYRLWQPFSVLWLLGAYLELVKLTSDRAQTIDRSNYYRRLQNLRMVGGGFPEFERLSQQIYTLLDDCVTGASVTQVSQQIKAHLDQTSWMPQTFRAILNGKNHLPTSKLHPRLLRRKQGFFGTGDYRTHFFADKTLPFFIQFYLRDRAKYGSSVLQLKRTAKLWRRGLLPSPQVGTAIVSDWPSAIAISAMVISGLVIGPRMLNSSPNLASTASVDKTVMGLVNFLDNPTEFKLACGNHAGQVVDAQVQGDRITIKVVSGGIDPRRVTLTGSLNEQGVFNGTYQTELPTGLAFGKVRLNFDQDGSAQGVNEDWGGAIAILKI
ncbi:Kynurenine 3-monooxygenase [Acaryochloris thomasi RCC1774]|uniref:Kynurenine 3-monooxygenase n=1 Tax=Acaryochloris thomasi RCC1774 TaxID=1764569 RepID=A0A2W1JMT2_9CYAN|nr:NAD(P)/FAD-dependent oxidoreductase [Acaryochloris thomasi]PZD72202.1 Kynurenine 3-monooxygenase [Acaryochloris thomasi RCC1774]